MKLQLLIAIGHQDYMEHLSDVLTQRYGETFEVSVCSTGERLRDGSMRHCWTRPWRRRRI